MKRIFVIFLSLIFVLSLCSCQKSLDEQSTADFVSTNQSDESPTAKPTSEDTADENEMQENGKNMLTVNGTQFSFTLEENETAKEFSKAFPLSLAMTELNGNEKYHYIDYSLPTDEKSVVLINKGDIMLYGDRCIVVFYKTFPTSYKYTKIGHIDNPDKLEEALGDGDALVDFSKK